jgi:hypothetical protein
MRRHQGETDMTAIETPTSLRPIDGLAHRALELVEGGTTEMADHVLRVPLTYYGDAEQHRR